MPSTPPRVGGVSGWRGKLGYMFPAVLPGKAVLHFYQVAPEGVDIRLVTLGITQLTVDEIEQALAKIDDAARRLGQYGVKFVSLGGAPLVSFLGYGKDRELIERIEKHARCPATTGLTVALDAFRALSVKKIVMATPQRHEVDARIRKFLEAGGMQVLNVKSLNLDMNWKIQDLPESVAYETMRDALMEAPEAEAIYDPCGGWGSPAVIDLVECDFGKPVVSNTQAFLWMGLKILRIKEPVKGYGRLFEV